MAKERHSRRARTWLFTGVPGGGSNGGRLRAAHLPRALIQRTGGFVLPAYGRRGTPAIAAATALESRAWQRAINVYSAQLWTLPALRLLARGVRGRVLDLHDHPRLQNDAFGIPTTPHRRAQLDDLVSRNVEAFERLVVPSHSFAELCSLPKERVIVATNGTDTRAIRPGPWTDEPVVALISGAVPGRGIELLIEAVRRIRGDDPRVTLRLALTATGSASRRYLSALRSSAAELGWIRIDTIPYESLATFFAGVQVLVIPHPPGPYLDVATPVKLFDGMAAGRPTVVTPRLEMAAIVREHDAGLVTAGDRPDDLAAAIERLLRDDALRRSMGNNARFAAGTNYDWEMISTRVADAVLAD